MPMDVFANAVGVRPPVPIVLLDDEQQRMLRDDHPSRPASEQAPPPVRRGSSGGALFVPTTPPMLPIPQHVAAQAPPPPTTNYLRTDFTTGRRPSPVAEKPREPGDGIRTNFTTNRQTSNPVANFMKDNAAANASGGSFSPPTDYDNVEPTAMPFISSTEQPRDVQPDPTRGFRGNGSHLKLSVRYMILGAVAGLALGIVFAHVGVSDLAAQWIALPGDLFLRAVNALVVPYVFCSVAVAVGDIVFVGKVSIVGLQTLKIFATGWVVSTVLGITVAFAFRPLFRLKNRFASPDANAVGLTCSNGLMLETLSNSSVTCSSNATELSLANAFVLTDVNKVFETNSDAVITDLTLSSQLISTLEAVVPDNIFASLADGDLLAIISFAMVLGSIAGRSYFSKTRRVNYLYLVLLQMRNTFFLAMEWVIWVTPVAVVSTIAGAFASNQDAVSQLPKVYMFLVACIAATVLQILVVYPFVIFLFARCVRAHAPHAPVVPLRVRLVVVAGHGPRHARLRPEGARVLPVNRHLRRLYWRRHEHVRLGMVLPHRHRLLGRVLGQRRPAHVPAPCGHLLPHTRGVRWHAARAERRHGAHVHHVQDRLRCQLAAVHVGAVRRHGLLRGPPVHHLQRQRRHHGAQGDRREHGRDRRGRPARPAQLGFESLHAVHTIQSYRR